MSIYDYVRPHQQSLKVANNQEARWAQEGTYKAVTLCVDSASLNVQLRLFSRHTIDEVTRCRLVQPGSSASLGPKYHDYCLHALFKP